jgi:flagellar biosynthesis/type III secretory pathway protein FliH
LETKEQALQGVEKMIEASEESLAKYNEGYREGFSDGYDVALEKAREVAEKYNLGVEMHVKELKPATRFIGLSFPDQLKKIHDEYQEVISAYMDKEGRARIAEELVDMQEAIETALAILGLSEEQRKEARRNVVMKNSMRGYYQGD